MVVILMLLQLVEHQVAFLAVAQQPDFIRHAFLFKISNRISDGHLAAFDRQVLGHQRAHAFFQRGHFSGVERRAACHLAVEPAGRH